jgi:hypothetical protein
MIARDDPLLSSAVSRVVSAYNAACHESADLPAFQRLLTDPKLGLTPDERSAIRNTSERRLTAEIWAEMTRRRDKDCFPYTLRRKPHEVRHSHPA